MSFQSVNLEELPNFLFFFEFLTSIKSHFRVGQIDLFDLHSTDKETWGSPIHLSYPLLPFSLRSPYLLSPQRQPYIPSELDHLPTPYLWLNQEWRFDQSWPNFLSCWVWGLPCAWGPVTLYWENGIRVTVRLCKQFLYIWSWQGRSRFVVYTMQLKQYRGLH